MVTALQSYMILTKFVYFKHFTVLTIYVVFFTLAIGNSNLVL